MKKETMKQTRAHVSWLLNGLIVLLLSSLFVVLIVMWVSLLLGRAP